MTTTCLVVILVLCLSSAASSFRFQIGCRTLSKESHQPGISLYSSTNEEEYKNLFSKLASGFFNKEEVASNNNVIDAINWNVKKRKTVTLKSMISILEKSLRQREWFVTGNVDPTLFSESFKFQDPDVKVSGVERYYSLSNNSSTSSLK